MEREERKERRKEREERGRRGGEMRKGIVIGGMVLSLLLGCNNGVVEELEKKNTFFDSIVKIGHEFQEIFGIFGNALGDALSFSAVKSSDKRNKVGKHFESVEKGLKSTKDQLNDLMKDIASTPNADTTGVEAVIKGSSEIIAKLITSVNKLAEVTKQDSTNDIGELIHDRAAVGANPADVNIVIEKIKEIIKTAKDSGIEIDKGTDDGKAVVHESGAGATAAIVGKQSAQAGANAAAKLADEVAKADPWAMISKIENAKTGAVLGQNDDNEVGALATGIASGGNNVGAKTNADLVAAVALKAMTRDGKFSAQNANEAPAVKGAAVSAVNKVLGILDEIIRRTVAKNLEKVREAVKGIKYSETSGTNPTEASTSTK